MGTHAYESYAIPKNRRPSPRLGIWVPHAVHREKSVLLQIMFVCYCGIKKASMGRKETQSVRAGLEVIHKLGPGPRNFTSLLRKHLYQPQVA